MSIFTFKLLCNLHTSISVRYLFSQVVKYMAKITQQNVYLQNTRYQFIFYIEAIFFDFICVIR
jgi:hypothetical protein